MLTAGDVDPTVRQLAVMDSQGNVEVYTGEHCVDYAGHIVGEGFSVQGNMLSGKAVIEATFESMKNSKGKSMPVRILNALDAGQEAGGDKRGRQSAALMVVGDADPVFKKSNFIDPQRTNVNIRVDDASEPLKELRRIYSKWTDVFGEDETIPINEVQAQISEALRKKGYSSLEKWAFDNNFTARITSDRISRRVLEILTERS